MEQLLLCFGRAAADVVRLLHIVPCLNLPTDAALMDGLAGGTSLKHLLESAQQESSNWQHSKVGIALWPFSDLIDFFVIALWLHKLQDNCVASHYWGSRHTAPTQRNTLPLPFDGADPPV